jgi:hypothetical protein
MVLAERVLLSSPPASELVSRLTSRPASRPASPTQFLLQALVLASLERFSLQALVLASQRSSQRSS